MRKTTLMVMAMGAALVASPSRVTARQGPAVRAVGEATAVTPESLEQEAEALFSSPKKYGKAVKLYVKAADLREPGDPKRVTDLVMASRLSFYAGNEVRGLELMERAADEALAAGDVVRSANAYIDASFLAREAGNMEAVLELVAKARLLTASPLIAANDRQAILARINA
ncbi:MAG: hypothetical protein ACREL7_19025 [Longimicrobiales bacterium]